MTTILSTTLLFLFSAVALGAQVSYPVNCVSKDVTHKFPVRIEILKASRAVYSNGNLHYVQAPLINIGTTRTQNDMQTLGAFFDDDSLELGTLFWRFDIDTFELPDGNLQFSTKSLREIHAPMGLPEHTLTINLASGEGIYTGWALEPNPRTSAEEGFSFVKNYPVLCSFE